MRPWCSCWCQCVVTQSKPRWTGVKTLDMTSVGFFILCLVYMQLLCAYALFLFLFVCHCPPPTPPPWRERCRSVVNAVMLYASLSVMAEIMSMHGNKFTSQTQLSEWLFPQPLCICEWKRSRMLTPRAAAHWVAFILKVSHSCAYSPSLLALGAHVDVCESGLAGVRSAVSGSYS